MSYTGKEEVGLIEEVKNMCDVDGKFENEEFLSKLETSINTIVDDLINKTEDEIASYFVDGKQSFRDSSMNEFFQKLFRIDMPDTNEMESPSLSGFYSFSTVSMILRESKCEMLKFLVSYSLSYFYSKYNRYNNKQQDVSVTQELLDEFLRLEIPHFLFSYLLNPPFSHESIKVREKGRRNEEEGRFLHIESSTVEFITNNFIGLTSFFLSDCFSDDRIANSVIQKFKREAMTVGTKKKRKTTKLDQILGSISKRFIGGSNLMMKVRSRKYVKDEAGKRSMMEYKQLSSSYVLEKLSMYEYPNSFLLRNRYFKNHLFQKLKQQQEQFFESVSSNKYYFSLLLSICTKLLNVEKNTGDWIRYFSNNVLVVFDIIWKFSVENKEDYRSLTDILVLLEKICRNDPMAAGKLLKRRTQSIPIFYSLIVLYDPANSEEDNGDLKNVVFYSKRILQVLKRVTMKYRVPNIYLSNEAKMISISKEYSKDREWDWNFDGAGPNRPSQIFKEVRMYKCEFCGVEREDIKVCGRCKNSFYCSRECQLQNWKFHKLKCKRRTDEQ